MKEPRESGKRLCGNDHRNSEDDSESDQAEIIQKETKNKFRESQGGATHSLECSETESLSSNLCNLLETIIFFG